MIGNISDDDLILDYRGVDTAIFTVDFASRFQCFASHVDVPRPAKHPARWLYDHISLPWPLLMNPICHVLFCKQPSVATVEQKMLKDHSR